MPTKIPAEIGEKWCTACGQKKPFADFHADANTDDGYRSNCKECRKVLVEEDPLDPRLQALEEKGLDTLARLEDGGSFVPHAAELLESLMRPFGGVDGFSKVVYATFYTCPPGSARRVKMIEQMVSLTKFVSNHDGGELLEHMDDSDLKQVMQKALLEYQNKLGLPSHAVPTLETTASKVAT